MTIINTLEAVKTLTKAVPTLNENNKVKSWDLSIEYSLNEYKSNFSKNVNIENPDKEISQFSKSDLMNLLNIAHLDQVFESQYTSVHLATPSSDTVVSDFDINSLN